MVDESRMAVVEVKVGTLEKSIETMADGIQHLVIAEAKREQDREVFDRLFLENRETKASIIAVDKKLDTYITSEQHAKIAAYKGVVLKLVSLAGLILASGITGYLFHTHLL